MKKKMMVIMALAMSMLVGGCGTAKTTTTESPVVATTEGVAATDNTEFSETTETVTVANAETGETVEVPKSSVSSSVTDDTNTNDNPEQIYFSDETLSFDDYSSDDANQSWLTVSTDMLDYYKDQITALAVPNLKGIVEPLDTSDCGYADSYTVVTSAVKFFEYYYPSYKLTFEEMYATGAAKLNFSNGVNTYIVYSFYAMGYSGKSYIDCYCILQDPAYDYELVTPTSSTVAHTFCGLNVYDETELTDDYKAFLGIE